jgi:hypothetical protein
MEQTECSETSEYKLQKPGITHKKAHNIQNTAKVWNPDHVTISVHIRSVSHLPVQLSVHEVYCLLLEQQPHWARAYWLSRFLDHTQRRNTVGRTPLGEWSARRRDLYLKTHNTNKRDFHAPGWDSNPQFHQATNRLLPVRIIRTSEISLCYWSASIRIN